MRAGEHLFAQTAQAFRYLQDRRALGTISMPEIWVESKTAFGRQAALQRAAT